MGKKKGDGNILMTDKWTTPKWLYEQLNKEFQFDYDPCPIDYDKSFDGRETEWGARNYVNPPYKELESWLKKGHEEYKKDKLVCFLLPVYSDTDWFHEYIPKATELRFIKERIKCGDCTEHARFPAPFPSCVAIFIPDSMTLTRGVKIGEQTRENGKEYWTKGCEHYECMF